MAGEVNDVTDDEWARLAELLCDHEPRDLALQILRLRVKVRCLVERLDQAGALSKAEWEESHLSHVELDNDE